MRTEILFVPVGGEVISIGEMPLELQGDVKRERASNILPVNRFKRVCFLLLRAVFGERGRVAEWTRQWYGPWTGRLFATGETFTAQSRRVVLDWERRRLEDFYERLQQEDQQA